MKAVILAAGKGTRMRELTNALPKPMLKVWGKPILQLILEGIKSAGIQEVFIVTGYCAETIESFFGDGRQFGLSIAYGRQEVQDGTGKAPEVAREFVGQDNFLLTYGDILVRPETYRQMRDRFESGPYSGLQAVTLGEDVSKGAIVIFDQDFCMKRLVEKPSAEDLEKLRLEGLYKTGDPAWYNAGIYIFRPLVYDYTARLAKSPRGEYELTDAIIAMGKDGHRLAGLQIPGRWVDVRDPEILAGLEKQSF